MIINLLHQCGRVNLFNVLDHKFYNRTYIHRADLIGTNSEFRIIRNDKQTVLLLKITMVKPILYCKRSAIWFYTILQTINLKHCETNKTKRYANLMNQYQYFFIFFLYTLPVNNRKYIEINTGCCEKTKLILSFKLFKKKLKYFIISNFVKSDQMTNRFVGNSSWKTLVAVEYKFHLWCIDNDIV